MRGKQEPVFCKRPCKGCGEKYLILGTGRKYCVECDPMLTRTLKKYNRPPYKARLTEEQVNIILDLQSEFQQMNQVIIAKNLVLNELERMAENEKIFAEVLEKYGLDANGRPKSKAPEGSVSSEAN